jgi:hypothetical protein
MVFTNEEGENLLKEYLESGKNFQKTEKVLKKRAVEKIDDEKVLNRIENRQKEMLEILKTFPITRKRKIVESEEKFLLSNLRVFSNKLSILSTNSENSYISELLQNLNELSQIIFLNAFYNLEKKSSLLTTTIEALDNFMGSSELNREILENQKLLRKFQEISEMDIFPKNYNLSSILLEKGLYLNSITILNEVLSIYIVESAKGFSEDIRIYIERIEEQNRYKFYTQVKDFFISLQGKNVVPFFPNHQTLRDKDEKIAQKFRNLEKTLKNKGHNGAFENYRYLIEQVRHIRNSLAHGNLDISFRDLNDRMIEFNKDFHYLAIEKNIFRR